MRQRQDLPGAYPVQIPPFILITQEPDSSASALSARKAEIYRGKAGKNSARAGTGRLF